jgi:methionyl-tRNA formyltransferase
MRCLLLTQDEKVFLPKSVDALCKRQHHNMAAIVVAPAMSTHGGWWRGLLRHVLLFGFSGVKGWARVLAKATIKERWASLFSTPSVGSIEQIAKRYDIPFFRVDEINCPKFHGLLDRLSSDLLISLSCPQVIGKKIRERFSLGAINVHGAPLPRYRGLMPAFWMLKNGESMAAATVHDLAARLDDGAILVQLTAPISKNETWETLVQKTKALGVDALIEAIDQIENGIVQRRPNQDDLATYFSFPTWKDSREFLNSGKRFF